MPALDPHETLLEYERMVDRLLEQSTKDITERAARVLASYVAHYQLRHGIISEADRATLNTAPRHTDQISARAEALRVLAAALTLAAVAPPEP